MAELRPHYIDVDLKKNTQYNVPVVTQNDTATHFIIRVTDDGLSDPELLDAYQEITMTSQRPDGESFYLTGTRIPGTNEIEFHLGTDETAFHGSVLASLQFYLVEDASRYTSAQFRYDVKKDLTKNYTPTQREETLVEVVLKEGPGVIQEAKDAKIAVDGALVELEQDKTAAIERLDEVTEENKTVFRQPVNTFADLATTYPNPEHGTTVRVTSEAASYRYSDGTWVKTDEYNPTAIDQVTAQLAATASDVVDVIDTKINFHTSVRYAQEPFSGTTSTQHTFSHPMLGFVISNDGESDLTFEINGFSYTVKKGEIFESGFNPFSTVSISAAGAYRAYGISDTALPTFSIVRFIDPTNRITATSSATWKTSAFAVKRNLNVFSLFSRGNLANKAWQIWTVNTDTMRLGEKLAEGIFGQNQENDTTINESYNRANLSSPLTLNAGAMYAISFDGTAGGIFNASDPIARVNNDFIDNTGGYYASAVPANNVILNTGYVYDTKLQVSL